MANQLPKPPMGKHELGFTWGMLIGLAEKLPKYNPEWDTETRDKWLEAFHSTLEAGADLSRFADELEWYERDRKDQLSTQNRQLGDTI